jgi:3-hydroxy acid dehydrogenase / malonic semialdehyde reductase
MSRTILITGATAGFGQAAARRFAKEGDRVIITGRRADRLDTLQAEIESVYGTDVHTLNFDVREQTEVEKHIGGLPVEWNDIDILINNAGLAAGRDPIQDGLRDDWERMIDTNVKGLLYVTEAVIPLMKKTGKGHIINIGSTAGKEVYPAGNVYCASKHAVDALSKGMRIDLLPLGIKVTQISPGMANTEFSRVRFHGDKEKADAAYEGYQPITAEDIAELIYYSSSLPDHLCINDILVTCLAQANNYIIHKE